MSTPKAVSFVIIDDDPLNNIMCKVCIKTAAPNAELMVFDKPEAGLKYLQEECGKPIIRKSILLLDINMPILSGWDIIDILQTDEAAVRERFIIYILSSSISLTDKDKTTNTPLIKAFIEKPISIDAVKIILADMQ